MGMVCGGMSDGSDAYYLLLLLLLLRAIGRPAGCTMPTVYCVSEIGRICFFKQSSYRLSALNDHCVCKIGAKTSTCISRSPRFRRSGFSTVPSRLDLR